MGDRVSISFVTRGASGRVDDESVAVFDHWGGKEFPKKASEYVKLRLPNKMSPSDAIAPFMFWLGKDAADCLYFGATSNDGDNSDNGHYRIDCDTGEISSVRVKEKVRDPPKPAVAHNHIVKALIEIDTIVKELQKAQSTLEEMK